MSSLPERLLRPYFEVADVIPGGSRPWDIQIHDPRFYGRLLRDGSIGLGETYMEGWWDCEALDQLVFRVVQPQRPELHRLNWRGMLAKARRALRHPQTPTGSRKAVMAHYDVGNAFFEGLLGPSMTYSCGYWRHATTLEQAQDAKHDLIYRKLGLGPGMRVLDVGCGWGSFARFAAERGAEVVGVTLSAPQAAYGRDRCRGLPVTILELDYRDPALAALGPFDRIASVGMFEHVGAAFYATFFQAMCDLLTPGGVFLLHTIGRHDSDANDPWVERYIFPGGELPQAGEIVNALPLGLVLEDWHNFGADYDRTLMAWVENLKYRCGAEIASRGEPFKRMWHFYLCSFAGNFRTRWGFQLWQVALSRGGVPGGYGSAR